MSVDFIANYLTFGPRRAAIPREGTPLPLFLGAWLMPTIPQDLLSLAETIRREGHDLPEHVLRRKVRDALDSARRRPGVLTAEGLQGVESALREILTDAVTEENQ